MATVKAIYRTDKPHKGGTFPIVIRITDRERTKYISLKERTTKEQWNDKKGEVNGKHPDRIRVNRKIHAMISEIRLKMDDAIMGRAKLNLDSLSATHKGLDKNNVFTYAHRKMEHYKMNSQGGTYRKVKSHIMKLEDYANGFIGINELDNSFILKYIKYLREKRKNSNSTIYANIKTLKAIFTEIKRDFPALDNPFNGIRIEQSVPQRTKLTLEEIERFANVTNLTDKQKIWRDLFLFSFYCWGMRFRDILFLKPENINNGVLSYLTSKSRFTKRITLRMNDYSLGVVKVHGNMNGKRLFPLLNPAITDPVKLETHIATLNVLANRSVEKAAIKAGIAKEVSFHIARHSFVDTMKQGGIPIEMRMQMVGHTSESVHRRYHDDFATEIMSNAVQNALTIPTEKSK